MEEHSPATSGPLTAGEVERIVLSRVAARQYAPGARLPTCDALGRELGASKNTVSKAYRALARRGHLSSSPGRGTFATLTPDPARRGAAIREISSAIQAAVEQADLSGLAQAELMDLAASVIRRHFDRVAVRVGYVDCCRTDSQTLGRSLQEAIAVRVEPLVLDQVRRDIALVRDRFDILAVNLSHLAAVERWLARDPGRMPEIVAILSLPDPTCLMQAARLPAGTRLLVVADVIQTLHVLRGLVRSLNEAIEVAAVASDDPGLAGAAAAADAILVTGSAHPRVAVLRPAVPLIPVTFKLDEQSTTYLADRVARLDGPRDPLPRSLVARSRS